MDLSYKPKQRRVVPNWRYYEATLEAGELNEWRLSQREGETYAIDDYVELWKNHKSLFRAGDLISAAITNGKEDNETVKDAAKYILDREDAATYSMLTSAQRVIGVAESVKSLYTKESERLRECTATKNIYDYIHKMRLRLQLVPYNPYLYVDLSRAYLLLGQTKKAQEAIEQALLYGATDRFVARSAARFFLHLQDKERAHDVIRAKGAFAYDPWLMAAEISINMLREKTSNYVKKGKEIIESGNCSPFGYTELASSIGTLELSAGANRKSNKLFRKALIDPNDNSLAQVQWVGSLEHLSLKLNIPVHNDYEVRTIEAITNGDADQAIHEAVSWICDMPFAHKPINVGYTICTTLLKDFALASEILDVGLRSDDNSPLLLNNKAYCSARANDLVKAKDAFGKLNRSSRKDETKSMKVCIPATEGLILYRSGQVEEGANKYKEAIDIAKEISETTEEKELYKKAMLNYCRERLIAKDGDPNTVLEDAGNVAIGTENVELKLLFEEVTNEYSKLKDE